MAAEFIYPTRGNFSDENNNQMINVFDLLYVEYNSSWVSANLTLYCYIGDPGLTWQYTDAAGNPLLASGTYRFGTIHTIGFAINQYPTNCHFKMSDAGADVLNGETFWITSNAASSTTFQPSLNAISTGSGAAITQSAKSTGPASIGVSGTQSSSHAFATSQANNNSTTESSHGLTKGAVAGVGVGITLFGLAAIAALVYIWLTWRKRKLQRTTPEEDRRAENLYQEYKVEAPNNEVPRQLNGSGLPVAELEGRQIPVEIM